MGQIITDHQFTKTTVNVATPKSYQSETRAHQEMRYPISPNVT